MKASEAKSLGVRDNQTDDWQLDATMDLIDNAARWGKTAVTVGIILSTPLQNRFRALGFNVYVPVLTQTTVVDWNSPTA